MQINPDGTFNIKKGEPMPFVCPACLMIIPYEKELIMVRCPRCYFLGDILEFSSTIIYLKEI